MKYTLLNQSPTTGEYGHYVSYSDETGKVTYSFEYRKTPLERIWYALSEIREIAGSDLNMCLYGKSGNPSYNTGIWGAVTGNIDSDLKATLDKDYSWFTQIEELIVPGGAVLDFSHFWATLCSYTSGNGDLGGWVGDIIQYSADLKANSSLVFPAASFGELDYNSDLDAHNIYYRATSIDLIDAMKSYYDNDRVTPRMRATEFLSKGSNLYNRFVGDGLSPLYAALMTVYHVNTTDVSNAVVKMQNYVNGIVGA